MAGGVTLGFLKYVLGFDSIQFRKGMTDAERDLVGLQKSFEKKGRQITELGKGLTAFITLPIAGIAAAGIKEAQETQQAMAQVNASLASMGPVAGRSAKQLQDFANALELKSTFEADEILRRVTANMLTFGNVSGQAFDRAQQAAVDLATRMGTDLQSATILVGKALNDPVKGLSALGRAGIQFSASQKEAIKAMVETGNTAGAQAIILGELERQFKGSAAAAANTDPLNQANKAWKQMAETVGTALLPILPVFANAVVSVANAFTSLPTGVQQTIIVMAGVAAAIGPVLIGLGGLVKLLAASKTIVLFSQGLLGLAAAEGTAATGATAAGIAFRVMLGPIGLAITAATALYFAFKHWDEIKPIVQRMVTGVADALRNMAAGPLENAKKRIAEVTEAFRTMWDKVVGHSYVPDTVDAIQQHFGRLGSVMVGPAEKATKATTEAFQKLKDDVSTLLDQLFPEDAQFKQQAADLALLSKALEKGVIDWNKYADARARVGGQQSALQPSDEIAHPQPLDQMKGPDLGATLGQLEQLNGMMGPIADFFRQIPQNAGEINVALQGIAVNGLRSFNDGLTEALMSSRSLKDFWHNLGAVVHSVAAQMLADLLKLAMQEAELAIFKTIFGGSALGGGFGGARALGGPVMGGTAYLVGERGPEIFVPSGGGKIISNDNMRSGLRSGVSVPINIAIDATGADAAGLARVQGELRELKATLPSTIVGTMKDVDTRTFGNWRR